MSAGEIGHRVVEQVRRRSGRGRRPVAEIGAGELPVIPGLRKRLLALPESAVPRDEWRHIYDEAIAGSFKALGRRWPNLPASDHRWHLDPVTGKNWPAEPYCFDVPYRHTEEFGDVKYVWEYNRLQNLQAVAAYAAKSGDEAAAAICRRDIMSWISANPAYRGVNWASGIELALRVVSVIVITSLIGPDSFAREERTAILEMLALHAKWIARFPSLYSSANNHLVAEAGALFILGTLAPELPGAAQWAAVGRRTLESEIVKQIHPDGVGAEQSPTYTAFSLEWWLLAARIAEASGSPFSGAVTDRIAAAATFLRWILDENDHHPRIGDDDEGRVIFSPLADGAYVPMVLQMAAAHLGDPALMPARDYPHLWLAIGADLPGRTTVPAGLRVFREGGYTVVRNRDASGERVLVFDHGPLGYLSIAAHGHADALGLWLHLDGRPVLVDGGTYLYHSGGRWRDHFRGTRAHNTLVVNGESSSTVAGHFNWSTKARAQLEGVDPTEGGWRVSALHDGYARRYGVHHHRTVEGGGAAADIVLTDALVGSGNDVSVEIGFLVHPDLEVREMPERGILVSDGNRPLLALVAEGVLDATIVRGRSQPFEGWYSPRFGHREPAPRVVFHGSLPVGQAHRIVLRPFPEKM